MYKIYLALSLLILPATVSAQNKLSLTLEQAIEMAIRQNIDLQINRNQLDVNKAMHLESKMRHLPNVGINSSASRQLGQQFQLVEGELEVTNVATNYISTGVNANLNLFTGLERKNNFQATSKRMIAQEEAIKQNEQQVMLEVTRQFLQVLLDQELLRIATQNLANQQAQLKQMEGFVASGLRARADLLNQHSEVSRLEMARLEAEIQLENDLELLAINLQLPSGYELETVVDQHATSDTMLWEDLEIEELYQTALRNRPDLRMQQANEEAAMRELSMAKSVFLPQLSAFYNYNTFYTSLDSRSFLMQMQNIYPTNTFGVRLAIPIYNNHRNHTNVVRAEVAAKNEQLNREAVKRQIYREVQTAKLNYRSAIKRVSAADQQLEAANTNFQVQEERFNLGLGSFVEYAQANQTLVQAKADHSQAYYTARFNELILKFSLGIIN